VRKKLGGRKGNGETVELDFEISAR